MSNSLANELKEQADLLSLLGHVSRKRREALGMTAAQLGERATIASAKISQLELGSWDIDIESLFLVAKCLDTTPAALFAEIEQGGTVLQFETTK